MIDFVQEESSLMNSETCLNKQIFWMVDGVLILNRQNIKLSHLELAKSFQLIEDLSESGVKDFYENNYRGVYFVKDNLICFYSGIKSSFDYDLIEQVEGDIPRIIAFFGLNDFTKVCFGPKNPESLGPEKRNYIIGNIKEFLNKH